MMNSKLKELYEKAGFSSESDGSWPTTASVGSPLENLVKLVIEECATVAKLHSRSYSDGEAGAGASGASNAVKAYGYSLFAEE